MHLFPLPRVPVTTRMLAEHDAIDTMNDWGKNDVKGRMVLLGSRLHDMAGMLSAKFILQHDASTVAGRRVLLRRLRRVRKQSLILDREIAKLEEITGVTK